MVRVINNNLWSPVPWGWGCGGHHSCGGNNWLNKLFGYQMMFGMMNNMTNMFSNYATPPQQGGSFYPGLQLGGGGTAPMSYEEYLSKTEEQQAYSELKNTWTEFKISKIGDKYYAYLKSDKTQRVEADSIYDLMDGLNEYVDTNPDKFKSKPAKVETSNNGGDDDTAPVDDTADTDGAGVFAAREAATPAPENSRKVNDGWYIASTTKSDYLKARFTKENLSQVKNSAGAVASYLIKDWKASNIDDKQLKSKIIKQNPSIFNNDGDILPNADMNKFDIPTYDWASKNCKKEATTANKSKNEWSYGSTGQYTYNNGNGIHIKYQGTQNCIYQKNGNSSVDDDAIFVINGKEYTIICPNEKPDYTKCKKLDYCEITGQRSLGADFTLIHHETGKFNPTSADMNWKYTNHNSGAKENKTFRLLPINGGTWIDIYLKNGQVHMKQGNNEYLADDVMLGKQKF